MVTVIMKLGRTLGHAELPSTAEERYRMHMETASGTWTVAERDRLPDDGNRYEVVDGELFVTPMPRPRHQEIVKRLFLRIDAFVRAHRIGSAYESGTDVIYSERDGVVPDVAVYPFQPDQLPPRWKDAPAPLLVAEVLSDSTWRRDVGPKRNLYVREGVPVYWIVDGDRRRVTVVRPGADDVVVTDALRWQPDGVAATLEIDLHEIFP